MLDREFILKPSKLYLSLISVIWLFSLILLCLTLEIKVKIGSMILVGGYGCYLLWRYALLLSPHAIISLRCHADGHWHLSTHKQQFRAQLRGDSTVTGFVSVLRFRVEKRLLPVSCVVFKDSLSAQHYHQLLMVIRGN
jgi:hypothetical protein